MDKGAAMDAAMVECNAEMLSRCIYLVEMEASPWNTRQSPFSLQYTSH